LGSLAGLPFFISLKSLQLYPNTRANKKELRRQLLISLKVRFLEITFYYL
jgi:hypothetical protein